MALKTKPFAPDEIVVAWQGVAHGDYVVRRGERLRGDHPVVKSLPGAFVADGTPPNEMPSMWADMPEPSEDEPMIQVAPPVPPEKLVVCVQAFGVGSRWIKLGQSFSIDDEVVQQHRAFFARLVALEELG